MKIAVLFAGRVRGFEDCIETQKKFIFKNYDIDIYLAHNANNVDDNLELFQKLYNVKKIESIKIDLEPYLKYKNYNGYGMNGHNSVIMFKCIYEAFKMIPEEYDVVIYMRADEIISSSIEFEKLQENTIYIPEGNDYVGGINDQFAVGNYESMKKYCSLFENLTDYLDNKGAIFHPESLVKFHLEYQKLNIVRFPLSYTLHGLRRG